VEPLAGVVVHAAGAHQGQHLDRDVGVEGFRAADGVATLAGQAGGHDRQIPAADGDGALAEVEIEAAFRIGFDHVEVAQQVADRPVAVSRIPFGDVDVLIDVERASRQVGEEAEQSGLGCLGIVLPDLGGGGDGAGIDHRVAGNAAHRIEADGVEGFAGGLHAYLGMHVLATQKFQRQAIGEGFGDRLDREFLIAVSDRIDVAIGRGHHDAEILGICLGQFGDVTGHLALPAATEAMMHILNQILDRRCRELGTGHSQGIAASNPYRLQVPGCNERYPRSISYPVDRLSRRASAAWAYTLAGTGRRSHTRPSFARTSRVR
jgi:hypothetical protein